MITNDLMYKALVDKDPAFEGVFYAGIKTTGIFCRPTCTARKPKKEHVEYFQTANQAMLKGYRPCKICNPLIKPGSTPDYINSIIKELEANPALKIRDNELLQKGIAPDTIRRWFLKNHGITFHAYQRIYRINSAFNKLREGDSVTTVAFDSGYESLSGFNDSFKSVFGVSPANSKEKKVIAIRRFESPLGTMIAGAVDEGICLLEFSDRRMLENELKWLARRYNAHVMQGHNPHFVKLDEELEEYFHGKRKSFTVPLSFNGTEFQIKVWNALLKIPYGNTSSYKKQADMIHMPTSLRAVANANGMNRISILVPCHRVIGSDGTLTGYGGGVWRKKWLLDFEKNHLR